MESRRVAKASQTRCSCPPPPPPPTHTEARGLLRSEFPGVTALMSQTEQAREPGHAAEMDPSCQSHRMCPPPADRRQGTRRPCHDPCKGCGSAEGHASSGSGTVRTDVGESRGVRLIVSCLGPAPREGAGPAAGGRSVWPAVTEPERLRQGKRMGGGVRLGSRCQNELECSREGDGSLDGGRNFLPASFLPRPLSSLAGSRLEAGRAASRKKNQKQLFNDWRSCPA